MAKERTLVYIKYRDHVLYHRAQPESLKPQVRECVGWLVYDCAEYIILAWDRDAGPPTLRGGDPKASGLVVLCSDILEMKRIAQAKQGPESNSGTLKPLFRQNRAT
jgi:hypothetical protein